MDVKLERLLLALRDLGAPEVDRSVLLRRLLHLVEGDESKAVLRALFTYERNRVESDVYKALVKELNALENPSAIAERDRILILKARELYARTGRRRPKNDSDCSRLLLKDYPPGLDLYPRPSETRLRHIIGEGLSDEKTTAQSILDSVNNDPLPFD